MDFFDELCVKNVQRCEDKQGFDHGLAKWSIAEWTNAMAGECGEACNVAKKLIRIRDGVPGNKKSREEYTADLAQEISDTVIYAVLAAAAAGIDLRAAIIKTFNDKSDDVGSAIKLIGRRTTDYTSSEAKEDRHADLMRGY